MIKSTVRKPASKRSMKPRSAKKVGLSKNIAHVSVKKVAPRKASTMTLAKRKLRSIAKSASDMGDSVKRSITRITPVSSVRRKPSAHKAA